MEFEETIYNEKLNAQESLEEGYIDIEEYNDWIAEIEEEENYFYMDDEY